MKITFPLRPLSNYDRFNNLIQIVSSSSELQTLSSKNSVLVNTEQPVHYLSLKDIANKYMPNVMSRLNNIMSKGSKL